MKQTSQIQQPLGFTLVEVMVVITIIIVLAGLTVGGLQFVNAKRDNSKAEIQINLLSRGIEEYKLDQGDYPGDLNAGSNNKGENQSNMLFKALYWNSDEDEKGMDPDSYDDDQTIYLSELDPFNDTQKWIKGSGAISNDGASSKIIDPWKAEFRYRRGSGAMNPDYDLWSSGKDLETAGNGSDDKDKDDIRNF